MEVTELKKKSEELAKQFDDLEDKRQTTIEQRNRLNQQLSKLREEQLRLQGSYRAIQELLPEKERDENVSVSDGENLEKQEEKPEEKKN